jgi:hypothetical protein
MGTKMPNQIISTYLSEMEQRLEAPYRRGALINFGMWIAIALGGSFYVVVLL